MGFFDFFKKKNNKIYKPAYGLTTQFPYYSQFGDNIYRSEVVQECLNCIVKELKKLTPQHVLQKNINYYTLVQDDLQSVLENPNDLMTTSDFIEKIIWNLFFYYNSWIIPYWENKKLISLHPVQPENVYFLRDNSGKIFVKFIFTNGYECVINYSDVIHIRYNYSVSEFMGGNEEGKPDHNALLKSLELNNSLLHGVEKALKSTYAVNGIIKYNTFIDADKTEQNIKELTEKLRNNESGFLPLDLKGEFIPIKKDVKVLDELSLRFIDEKILRFFGLSIPILTGNYTKEQYEAFFQKTLEPIIVSLSQSFTKALCFKRGHKIIFNHKELSFMTMSEKIQWMTMASNVGAITINEMRAIIGYAPYDDEKLGNTPVMSKNFGNAEIVKDNVNEQ